MWLIVGLGNPGSKYLLTRHNIGFMAVDGFVSGAGTPPIKQEHQALTCRFRMEDEELLFAKPQTFMNKSGESVAALLNYYKIELSNLLVVHDDIEIPIGAMRFQTSRGHGGHNGIRSIHEVLNTMDYARLKLGVGRPPDPRMDVANWVLGNFSSEEQIQLPSFLNRAADGIESFIFEGLQKTASLFNQNLSTKEGN